MEASCITWICLGPVAAGVPPSITFLSAPLHRPARISKHKADDASDERPPERTPSQQRGQIGQHAGDPYQPSQAHDPT
ncbi:hypothetical protein DUNSADRAFT_12188 [Dunaliella salina]|uniref:Encoded protein n=1 Tax=Dunaliella salina TaxID=3046 RepID=A0ABQ7GBV1_DUNSA|nr:hypothetical protein DUNSADRAFT_12188 [Dunaliella salina]|eukprot:KAF5832075.1 hypothetical protein DUNSADRAFT_12188 [Dunaliella salina]